MNKARGANRPAPSLYKVGPGRAAAFEVLLRHVARLLLPALPTPGPSHGERGVRGGALGAARHDEAVRRGGAAPPVLGGRRGSAPAR